MVHFSISLLHVILNSITEKSSIKIPGGQGGRERRGGASTELQSNTPH